LIFEKTANVIGCQNLIKLNVQEPFKTFFNIRKYKIADAIRTLRKLKVAEGFKNVGMN